MANANLVFTEDPEQEKMIKEHLALNTKLWLPKPDETRTQAKKRTTQDFASGLLEQKEGRLEERINPYFLMVDPDGELTDLVSGKRLKKHLRRETYIDRLENIAFEEHISRWARENDSGHLIWISPPSEETGYTESRFIVMELVTKDSLKMLSCKGIPGAQSKKDCLEIAEKISRFSTTEFDLPKNADGLRARAIPFKPPPGMDSIDFLAQFIEPAEIWERIRKGKDLKEKKRALKVAQEIVDKTYQDMLSAKTEYDFMVVGGQMERRASFAEFVVQPIGSCGISNTEALARWGVFNTIYSAAFTGTYSSEKTFPCPKCGRPIPSGHGIIKCPYFGCTAKKEDYKVCG